ncbi:uncharacterized protein CELE_R07A4.2 [Caenorhabditis elegans]|uniref:Uncharacterized protein n=1 Tax=Caenorhabditis elegans TaxID=6239 RepID=Q21780_CAEEL|nr:Uncharacterized protein CELE_R07A4.2 [Caenorhabditis elegans]CAA91762.1 Uncharacterized protein CELE_R07A4.2 [Caenorhabditis elegans]|eukprot:NP_509796.1 Uncharacterized protein CELE_R07A4.2 [Caenorhabditis elegans]
MTDGPPLMLNRAFFERKENFLKILQLIFGFINLSANYWCYPNQHFLYCGERYFTSSQVFQLIVFNGFCLFLTLSLVVANVTGAYDAFYKTNPYVLERYLVFLQTFLYTVAYVTLIVDYENNPYAKAFAIPLISTTFTLLAYIIDSIMQLRRKNSFSQ